MSHQDASDSSDGQESQFEPNPDSSGSEQSDVDNVDRPIQRKEIINPRTQPRPTPVDQPTMQNYHCLGIGWGQARADRILAQLPNTISRPSPATLFEAQSLQAQYHLDKTMLCIINQITRDTLDEALYVIRITEVLVLMMAKERFLFWICTVMKAHWLNSQISTLTTSLIV